MELASHNSAQLVGSNPNACNIIERLFHLGNLIDLHIERGCACGYKQVSEKARNPGPCCISLG